MSQFKICTTLHLSGSLFIEILAQSPIVLKRLIPWVHAPWQNKSNIRCAYHQVGLGLSVLLHCIHCWSHDHKKYSWAQVTSDAYLSKIKLLYTHIIQLYIYTYICWIHTDAMIIKTSEDFFKKIYLSLYCKVCVWEGVGDRTELQYIDPHSYGHQRCVFLVFLMLNRRPAGFLYCILSPTGLVPKLHWESRGPLLLGGGFPYHILSLTHLISNLLISNSLTSCLHQVI